MVEKTLLGHLVIGFRPIHSDTVYETDCWEMSTAEFHDSSPGQMLLRQTSWNWQIGDVLNAMAHLQRLVLITIALTAAARWAEDSPKAKKRRKLWDFEKAGV